MPIFAASSRPPGTGTSPIREATAIGRAAMLELTPENAIDYLRSTGRLGPGSAQVELLGGGVSNIVLRVIAADRQFVLKQSRPQLRTRDAWFSDLDRIYREQEVMEALLPLLPPLTVPEVLFAD